jgi:pyruvate carboxylase subunit B
VDGDVFNVKVHPVDGSFKVTEGSEKPSAESVRGAVTSHMQGMVLSLKVSVGDAVEEGDTICVIEAMKMENAIHAPHSGTVKEIFFGEGDSVSSGDVLMAIE